MMRLARRIEHPLIVTIQGPRHANPRKHRRPIMFCDNNGAPIAAAPPVGQHCRRFASPAARAKCGLSCSFAGRAVTYSPASRKVVISPPSGNGIGASKARDQVIRRTARRRQELISYRFRIRSIGAVAELPGLENAVSPYSFARSGDPKEAVWEGVALEKSDGLRPHLNVRLRGTNFRIKALNVRFCPDSDHRADVAAGPKGAMSRHAPARVCCRLSGT